MSYFTWPIAIVSWQKRCLFPLGTMKAMDSAEVAGVKIMSGKAWDIKTTICWVFGESILMCRWCHPWLDRVLEFAFKRTGAWEAIIRWSESRPQRCKKNLPENNNLRVMCGRGLERPISQTIKENIMVESLVGSLIFLARWTGSGLVWHR